MTGSGFQAWELGSETCSLAHDTIHGLEADIVTSTVQKGSWESERLDNLPEVTQLGCARMALEPRPSNCRAWMPPFRVPSLCGLPCEVSAAPLHWRPCLCHKRQQCTHFITLHLHVKNSCSIYWAFFSVGPRRLTCVYDQFQSKSLCLC